VRTRVIGWDVRLDGGTNGDWKRPTWLGDRPRSDKPNHMTYLVGQGLAGLPNRVETPNKPFLTRPAIGIGSKITVRFTAISQESWIPTRNALWALLRFGGLGSRSGRGFGRMQAQTDPTGLSILDHPDWHDLAFIRDNLGVTNLRRFEDFPQQGTYPNFREGCYRITDLGTLGSSWATCSIELGYRWRVARASTPAPTAAYMPKAKTPEWLDFVKHKPMRSGEFPLEALGLPVVYQSRNSFDWGVSRTVNLHDSSDLSRELRQKSPILFAIDKVTTPTAGWKATALAFYTEIPPGVTLRLTEKRPKDDPSPVPAPVSLQTGDARARLDQAMTDLANPQIPR
jgi:hypothetical protein